MGTPQRQSSRKVARNAKKAMKSLLLPEGERCKSQVGGVPKRQAVGSPQAGEFNNTNALYIPGLQSEREANGM